MRFVTNWEDLPEVEVLPNNFRKSAAGLKTGINRIRLVHPSGTPVHQHDDSEQSVLMMSGRMILHVNDDSREIGPGDIAVIPIGTPHRFETIEGEVVLIETFSPMRVQNLIGYLGNIF